MSMTNYELTDSRGVRWNARLSGPTSAGSLQEGESLNNLPEIYILRFHRKSDPEHEIVLDLDSAGISDEEARLLLEQEPEWIHEDWPKR